MVCSNNIFMMRECVIIHLTSLLVDFQVDHLSNHHTRSLDRVQGRTNNSCTCLCASCVPLEGGYHQTLVGSFFVGISRVNSHITFSIVLNKVMKKQRADNALQNALGGCQKLHVDFSMLKIDLSM